MGPPLNRARLKAAGNAVVPGIAEVLGRVIMRIEASQQELATGEQPAPRCLRAGADAVGGGGDFRG